MAARTYEFHIRDPIHGSIRVSPQELPIVESAACQRLRGIRQMGFTDQAFPGATHTRFSHSLGAMEMVGRMFDTIFGGADLEGDSQSLPVPDRRRLRQLVRLAVLAHDWGHSPLSHATESCMPQRKALGLSCFSTEELSEQANHEDYSVLMLLSAPVRDLVQKTFLGEINVEQIAHLVSGRFPQTAKSFVVGGVDYCPILSQLVSGELDADRFDYLPRDSFYAGVRYGRFDDIWLLNNLQAHVVDHQAFLALSHRAIFAFEDFLLSRYHMFVSVYHHHTAVGLDTMLDKYVQEAGKEINFPTTAEAYLDFDDLAFLSCLRASKNLWARRIVKRQMFRRILEVNAEEAMPDVERLSGLLDQAKVEYFVSKDSGVLSHYYRSASSRPIYVVNASLNRVIPVEQYSQLFERYRTPTRLIRVYCHPDQEAVAQNCLRQLSGN